MSDQQPKRAAIYARVSTDRQEDGYSLQTQEEGCRALAALQGWMVDETQVYLETHSGMELRERPLLSRLREAIRARLVDVLLVHSIDRLARKTVHLWIVLEEADHYGVEIVFVTEPLDNTPEGQLIRSLRGYAAQIEHEKIVERNIRGHKARAASGKLLPGGNGNALYGYAWADEKTHAAYVPHEAHAAIVRRVFLLAAAGLSLRRIAKELTQDGIPSPTGGPVWGRSSIYAMLTHPFYGGSAYAYRWQTKPHKTVDPQTGELRTVSTNQERPASDHIPFTHETVPPLIPAELAEAVLDRLAMNKAHSSRHNKQPEATLLRNGFAVCGYCGKHMAATHARGAGYTCIHVPGNSLYIAASILDAAVWAAVRKVVMEPDMIARELEKRHAAPPIKELASLERQLKALNKQQGTLAGHLRRLSKDAGQPLLVEMERLAAQRRALEEERDALQAQMDHWHEQQGKIGNITAWCEAVAHEIDTFTYAEKRNALVALRVEARVWRADHSPRYEVEMHVPLGGGEYQRVLLSANRGDSAYSAGLLWALSHHPQIPTLRLCWTDRELSSCLRGPPIPPT